MSVTSFMAEISLRNSVKIIGMFKLNETKWSIELYDQTVDPHEKDCKFIRNYINAVKREREMLSDLLCSKDQHRTYHDTTFTFNGKKVIMTSPDIGRTIVDFDKIKQKGFVPMLKLMNQFINDIKI